MMATSPVSWPISKLLDAVLGASLVPSIAVAAAALPRAVPGALLWHVRRPQHRAPLLPFSSVPQAEADELNYILCTINAAALVEVCSRGTLELLTRERLPELATETRCHRDASPAGVRVRATHTPSPGYAR